MIKVKKKKVKTKPVRLSDKEFKYVYDRAPRLCVDLIIQKQQSIVLSKRDIPPAKGKWHLPGGSVLFGEKLAEAVKRKARVETGLKVKIKKIIGVVEYSSKSGYGQSIAVMFLICPLSGKLRGCAQARDIRFFKYLPNNTVVEQGKFLLEQKLIKKKD